MLRFRPLWIALLMVLLFSALSACGGETSVDVPSPDEPSQLQTYTAILIDRSDEPASTAYFPYVGDTTVGEILTALAETMAFELDLSDASVSTAEVRIVVGTASALYTATSESELRGYLNSIYTTVRQNYGIDKAIFITAGEGISRFGIDLSGTAAYAPQSTVAPTPGEGELTVEDAGLYATNLTYGLLNHAEIELVYTLNEVIAIGDAYYYDISVSSAADPGSIMRRFAIAFDGLSAYLYNPKTDAFEPF